LAAEFPVKARFTPGFLRKAGLTSIQVLLIGLLRLQLIQQMLRIHTRRHKSGSIADHHQEGLFATLIDGSNLIQVDDATPGRGLGNGGSPTGNQFGDRPLCQLALKDPSFLHGSLSDCDS
jgi:hypothetical protein